ncbi:hypothetical protein GCM10009678_77410 [Actinomadura kijaniata]|uniref:SnoaL-like domain-containing protein n=1 Tax=Actinomadura namibiensis TaxID=182080 RepID=A0A7W3LNR1_ACTNM|nr:nuclear transport factor 2 family protein [Actinomadura namibiensis]MBA8951469.1 hypothetical protein [Actinomadura namibiensis]
MTVTGEPVTGERLLTAFIRDYPREMGLTDEDPEAILDRYLAPDFVFRNYGVPVDRRRMLGQARPARRNTLDVETEIHEMLLDGPRFAARYTTRPTTRKGGTLEIHVLMFGELAEDGRIRRVDQITHTGRA